MCCREWSFLECKTLLLTDTYYTKIPFLFEEVFLLKFYLIVCARCTQGKGGRRHGGKHAFVLCSHLMRNLCVFLSFCLRGRALRIWDIRDRLFFLPCSAHKSASPVSRSETDRPSCESPLPEALSPPLDSTPSSGTTSPLDRKLRPMGAKRTHFRDYTASPI